MTEQRSADILGVRVDDVTMQDAIERIAGFIEAGRATGATHQVATVNVDFVVNAVHDPALRRLLTGTDLSIPDGMPIVWGARACGTPLRERVSGADLVPALAERAAVAGWRLYFFGSAPGIAEAARQILHERVPGASISADSGGRFARIEDTDPIALERIRAARPDILCVALGNPKQEWWIEHFRKELGVPVLIGVGGTFDLLTGDKRRAPSWMQRFGLEWVFRAAQEPRRLVRRYARDLFVFLPRMCAQIVRTRITTRSR
jgi:N-acetylglucosaminyldiphosphoundecaprenol N-acetyl-beta-D-mannosaminyltransferase